MRETLQTKQKNYQKVKLAFFVGASLITFYLAWQVFHPFIMLIATSVVAAIVLAPFHFWLTKVTGHHARVCAFLTTLLSVVIIGVPLAIGIFILIDEIGNLRGIDPKFLESSVWKILPRDLQQLFSSLELRDLVGRLTSYLSQNIASILASTSRLLFLTLLFFVTLYYLLAEREDIYRKVLAMSPLSDRVDSTFIQRLIKTIRAVVVGNVIVGSVQGMLAGIGFLIFGVPNAVVLSILTFIAAQIPAVGTAIITLPAALYLFGVGNTVGAIGLAIWGLILVGGIDNILRPKLVEGKTRMHPFLILLSMFGGLEFFGPVGFVLGPAVLAASLAFLEMYESGVLAGTKKL